MCDGKLFVASDDGLLVIGEDGPLESLPLTKAVTNTGEDFESEVEAEQFDDLTMLCFRYIGSGNK